MDLIVDGTRLAAPSPDSLELSGGEYAQEVVRLLDGTEAVQRSEKRGALRLRVNRTTGQVCTGAQRAGLLASYASGGAVGVSCLVTAGAGRWDGVPRFYPLPGDGPTEYEYELAFIMGAV